MADDWSKFPAATPLDEALHLEGIGGDVAAVARSIYQQESSSGKNTKTSNAGAVGGMQILPETFKRMADKGWDINDPVTNARAGVRYAKYMHERGGGDPALTAAGYYGGEGGQDKAKNGVAVRDPRNPNAPDTLQYGKQVASRLNKDGQKMANEKNVEDWDRFPRVDADASNGQKTADANGVGTPVPAAKRSMLDELGRQLGLTARGAVDGIVSIPAMVSDAVIATPINAVLDKYDEVRSPSMSELVTGKKKGFRLESARKATSDLMTMAGVAQPENATERVVQDVVSSMSGTGAMVKGGQALTRLAEKPVSQAVGKMLADNAGMQVSSAAAGAGASGSVREGGGGTVAQVAAGLAASLAPTVVPYATKSAIRGAVRGGEEGRKRVEETIRNFDAAAGTTPTVGQATGSRAIQAAETGLSNTIGSSGVMVRKAEEQAKALGDSVKELSDALAPNSSGMDAGAAIVKGVNAFRDGVKETQKKLYGVLDSHIPADTRVAADKTKAALAELNADIAGAPELSKWFKNARIQGIEGGLKSDTESIQAVLSRPGMQEQVDQLRSQLEANAAKIAAQNSEQSALGMRNNLTPVPTPEQIQGQVDDFLKQQIDSRIPYESLKKLRTLVGSELSENSLAPDVPRSKWRALYGALSDDLGEAAKASGPQAEQAWSRANQFTRASMERMDHLEKVINRDAPEKVFKAATSGLSDGGTTIRRVMQSMPVENRREVTSAVLQRLGKATKGMQNEPGDVFSSETFLSNLAAMSPEARKAIFDSSGFPGLSKRIKEMGQMATVRREGSQVFANPSGTARQSTMMGWFAALSGALGSGNPAAIAGVLSTPVGANVLAKTVTSKEFVQKLAQQTVANKAMAPAAVGAVIRSGQTAEQPSLPAETSDWDRFPRVEDYSPADTQQQGQETSPHIDLNSMAVPDDSEDPQDESLAPDSQMRPDGTLSLNGDSEGLLQMLSSAGVPRSSVAPMQGGVVVGRTQAQRVQELLSAMRSTAEQPVASPESASFAEQPPGLSTYPSEPTEQQAAAQPAQQAPAAFHTPERIQSLRDSGDERVANLLARQKTAEDTQTELAGMREQAPDLPFHGNPVFESTYAAQRLAGMSPAEASAHAGIFATAKEVAPQIGMPEKAVRALEQKLATIPIDEAPGFVQRFTNNLIKSGLMEPSEGAMQVAAVLGEARDRSMHSSLRAVYPKEVPTAQEPEPVKQEEPVPQEAGPVQKEGPVQVATREQRDALPPGTRYTAPNGRIYIKAA